MIFACLNLYSSHAFIYLSGISSQFPVIELLLNVIDLLSVLWAQHTTDGCNLERISAVSAKFIQFIIKNELLNEPSQSGAWRQGPKKLA